MNGWLAAAALLLAGVLPLGIVLIRADLASALVALQAAATILSLVLVILSVGYGRSAYGDTGVMLAILSFPAGMVFVRSLERFR